MKGNDLLKLVQNGKQPIIKFTEEIWTYAEESVDPRMMGKIIGVAKAYEDSIMVRIDMNGYEDYNKSVASHDWRDKNGVACLTWFEVGMYPKDGIETIYLPLEDELPIEFVEENSLLNEYVTEKSNLSYVQWLENKILELRD